MSEVTINYSKLESITEGDKELQREILGLFDDSAKRCLSRMQEKANDEEWNMAVHELKGAADNLGFKTIGDTCREAEEQFRTGSLSEDKKSAIVERILELIEKTRQQMNQNFDL